MYGILTVTLCGDNAVVWDPLVVRKERKLLLDGMNVDVVDGFHRYAALAVLCAEGTSNPR